MIAVTARSEKQREKKNMNRSRFFLKKQEKYLLFINNLNDKAPDNSDSLTLIITDLLRYKNININQTTETNTCKCVVDSH